MSVLNQTVQKEDAPELKRTLLRVLAGLALAVGMTLAVIAGLAALLFFTNISEKWVAPAATVLSLLSLFFGAKLAAKHAQGRGFVLGALVGILYYVLLYVCALFVLSDFTFSVRTAIFMLIGALTGGVGGLAGQAAPEKKGSRSTRRKKKK